VERSGGNPVMLAVLGGGYARAGDHAAARPLLDRLERIAGEREVASYEIGVIHAGLGKADAAFHRLERALAQRSAWPAYARVDPRLEPLRADPRFASVLERIGLAGPDAACGCHPPPGSGLLA